MKDLVNRTMEFHSSRNVPPPQRKRRPSSINFEAYAAEGNRFINEVAFDLDIDRDHAARITRAVLHALRDRLSPVDAVQFAQGLPMALKGIFIDQYNISHVPVRIRSKEKFLDYIYSKAGRSAPIDFPDRPSIQRGLQSVFYVLERTMSYGQVDQIKYMLNKELLEMIEEDTMTGFYYDL